MSGPHTDWQGMLPPMSRGQLYAFGAECLSLNEKEPWQERGRHGVYVTGRPGQRWSILHYIVSIVFLEEANVRGLCRKALLHHVFQRPRQMMRTENIEGTVDTMCEPIAGSGRRAEWRAQAVHVRQAAMQRQVRRRRQVALHARDVPG